MASQSPFNMQTKRTVSAFSRSLTMAVNDFDGIAGRKRSCGIILSTIGVAYGEQDSLDRVTSIPISLFCILCDCRFHVGNIKFLEKYFSLSF